MIDELADLLARYALECPGVRDEATLREVRRRVLDTVGVALGALDERAPRLARAYAFRASGPATVWGASEPSSLEGAVLANGAAIRYLDYNDSYFSVEACHPSDVISGLWAVAETEGASGKAFLDAVAVSYHLAVCVCDALSIRRHGWDHVNVLQIAACCGIGRLLGLTRPQLVEALGMTVVPHAVLRQARAGAPQMWKGLAAADGVRHAVHACLMAREGIEGPYLPFEGTFGFVNVLGAGEYADKAALDRLASLEEPTRILETHIKGAPLGHVAQSAAEAASSLHEVVGTLGNAARVHIETFGVSLELMGSPEKWRPETRETADHSLPYVVAVGLRDGAVSPAAFSESSIRSQAVRSLLADRMSAEVIPEFDDLYPDAFPVRITVETRDGATHEAEVHHPIGDARRPMDDGALEAKYRAMAEPFLGPRTDEVRDAVLSLDRAPDLTRLSALLAAEA